MIHHRLGCWEIRESICACLSAKYKITVFCSTIGCRAHKISSYSIILQFFILFYIYVCIHCTCNLIVFFFSPGTGSRREVQVPDPVPNDPSVRRQIPYRRYQSFNICQSESDNDSIVQLQLSKCLLDNKIIFFNLTCVALTTFIQILRSHVMVRVGGGWDTLSHYLDKHDPCRCKTGKLLFAQD